MNTEMGSFRKQSQPILSMSRVELESHWMPLSLTGHREDKFDLLYMPLEPKTHQWVFHEDSLICLQNTQIADYNLSTEKVLIHDLTPLERLGLKKNQWNWARCFTKDWVAWQNGNSTFFLKWREGILYQIQIEQDLFRLSQSDDGKNIFVGFRSGSHKDDTGYLCFFQDNQSEMLILEFLDVIPSSLGLLKVQPYLFAPFGNEFLAVASYDLIYCFDCKGQLIWKAAPLPRLMVLGMQPNVITLIRYLGQSKPKILISSQWARICILSSSGVVEGFLDFRNSQYFRKFTEPGYFPYFTDVFEIQGRFIVFYGHRIDPYTNYGGVFCTTWDNDIAWDFNLPLDATEDRSDTLAPFNLPMPSEEGFFAFTGFQRSRNPYRYKESLFLLDFDGTLIYKMHINGTPHQAAYIHKQFVIVTDQRLYLIHKA